MHGTFATILTPSQPQREAAVSTLTVRITHCVWRDGRPRFVPGPALRRIGYRGRDLKHPDGTWFSLEETRAFADHVVAEVEARRAAKAGGKRLPPLRDTGLVTVAQVVADTFARPEFQGRPTVDGKRRRKPLAARTVRWYREMAKVVEADHPELWTAPAAAVTAAVMEKVLEQVERDRGLATARGVRAVLSMCWTRQALRHGLRGNPAHAIELPDMEPRLRVGEIAEMKALVAAADAIGRPEIGDSIMLGLLTGQRQNDRLALTGGRVVDGRLVFRQSKTGAVVSILPAPPLVARLEAARARRRGSRVDAPEVIVDERTGRPFKARHYGRVFAEVRAAAVAGGEGREPCPSLADFRDQDLRDTAVTWLARAGSTVPEIAAITGHTLGSVHTILKHYLGQDVQLSDAAVTRLETWLDGQGADL